MFTVDKGAMPDSGEEDVPLNVERGGNVSTEVLITALYTGQIRGAALDVTDPEPLPNDHPLWKLRI
jgi:phosphoglycerate dehydrogenase-like enzyme